MRKSETYTRPIPICPDFLSASIYLFGSLTAHACHHNIGMENATKLRNARQNNNIKLHEKSRTFTMDALHTLLTTTSLHDTDNELFKNSSFVWQWRRRCRNIQPQVWITEWWVEKHEYRTIVECVVGWFIARVRSIDRMKFLRQFIWIWKITYRN